MKKTCCECGSTLLWHCEELLCVVNDKIVDGNDLACEEFEEKPKKVKNKDLVGEHVLSGIDYNITSLERRRE